MTTLTTTISRQVSIVEHSTTSKILIHKLSAQPYSIQEKLARLLYTLNQKVAFSAELQEMLQKHSLFLTPLFDDLNNWEFREKAAIDLCLLLSDVIYPAIEKIEERDEQKLLLSYETEVEDLLRSLLPEETNIKQYIEENQIFDDEESPFNEKLIRIKKCFQDMLKQLYSTANQKRTEMIQIYTDLNHRLAEVSENQNLKIKFYAHIDDLTERMNQITLTVLSDSENIQEKVEKIFEYAKAVENLLD